MMFSIVMGLLGGAFGLTLTRYLLFRAELRGDLRRGDVPSAEVVAGYHDNRVWAVLSGVLLTLLVAAA